MKNERYLTQNDAATLSRIAEHLLRMGEVEINAGEQLIDIISTSIILPVDVQRKGYVTLYSTVSYSPVDTEEVRKLTIVCPQDANPQLALISALTPIGLALIGRKALTTVEVALPSKRVEKLKILDVTPLDSTMGELALS
ncbi:transcription elongation factor, greA family [Janthinobacterium sp. Marseille]|nr:GreA/GreB family elongation factor [Janthinobacterium sp. Marseille]ABR90522.1 transcription elongation factor, greA family [Janthinobacterium sp. Marseille]